MSVTWVELWDTSGDVDLVALSLSPSSTVCSETALMAACHARQNSWCRVLQSSVLQKVSPSRSYLRRSASPAARASMIVS